MSKETLREQYEKAIQFSKLAFIERPLIGSPAAPAQAMTNVSATWSTIKTGFLFGYEYTRWWKESNALRNAAMIGDWSWLDKCIVRGPDASRFMNYATVKDLSRQKVGQVMYTPMVNVDGKVAIEGLTFRLAENEYMFSQTAAKKWLTYLHSLTKMDVELEDVTPDYTCYALQGPRSLEILEEVTGERFRDLRFSRWRMSKVNGVDVLISRQGVTGEIGYEFIMRTDTGKAHELWHTVREVGEKFGLREMGWRAQMIGHVETGIATVIKDYLPARTVGDSLTKFARLFITEEELAALDWDLSEQFCSPAELGWEHTINLDGHDFYGRAALVKEAEAGGPARRLVGLVWDSDDVAELFAAQFRDEPAPPPPDLPQGQLRALYLKVLKDGEHVGWATSYTYSPNIRRMISFGRVRKDLVEPGTEVAVLWGGFSTEPQCKIRARVAKLPFIEQKRTMDLSV
ncbi:MAG: glycine cleavage T C-terminal barrel domain-containing protein [Dehalococcoidia bacterium]